MVLIARGPVATDAHVEYIAGRDIAVACGATNGRT
jgi:hypothetical protein